MDLQGWVRALRKYWWIVVTATLLALGAGVVVTWQTPAQYASSVTFFVKTPAEGAGSAYQADMFGQKRVNSYVQLLGSRRLADLILADTQLNMTSGQVISEIAAKGDLNTVLLTATVTDPSPERSLTIANSIQKVFVEMVAAIETPTDSTTPAVTLDVTSAATLNPVPVAPRPVVNLGLALMAGLAVGVALAILREKLDTTVRSTQNLAELTGSSALGAIPFDETARNSPLIVDTHSRSIRAESLRQLRTNLQFIDVDNPPRVIVVTSSVPGEGKSSTATNLAVSFAEAGETVLLIEGDLRRPRVAEYLGIEGAVGLTNVLAGQVQIEDVLQPFGTGGLTVLPSGSIPPNPSELLGSDHMSELLELLKKKFAIIIIDTPPLLPVTDGAIAAAHADGAILVVRHGKTSRAVISSAVDALRAVDAKLLGCVLNMAPAKGPEGYGYGYGYGYESEDTARRGFLKDQVAEKAETPVVESFPAPTADGALAPAMDLYPSPAYSTNGARHAEPTASTR